MEEALQQGELEGSEVASPLDLMKDIHKSVAGLNEVINYLAIEGGGEDEAMEAVLKVANRCAALYEVLRWHQ